MLFLNMYSLFYHELKTHNYSKVKCQIRLLKFKMIGNIIDRLKHDC